MGYVRWYSQYDLGYQWYNWFLLNIIGYGWIKRKKNMLFWKIKEIGINFYASKTSF